MDQIFAKGTDLIDQYPFVLPCKYIDLKLSLYLLSLSREPVTG